MPAMCQHAEGEQSRLKAYSYQIKMFSAYATSLGSVRFFFIIYFYISSFFLLKEIYHFI